ncbi:hypothetical protein ADUPG1_004107, partial [Aduncisulcus paluster]
MRITQKESTDRRNGKIAEKINEYNDKMDEQMTKGLIDLPRDETGECIPEKGYYYRKGTYVLEKPAVKPKHKIGPRLEGPYLVLDHNIDTDTIAIQDLKTKKERRIAAARVIPFDDTEFTVAEMIGLSELDSQEYVLEEVLGHSRGASGRMKEVDRYRFTVKWLGYKDPYDGETYKSICHTPAFKTYCNTRPTLKKIFASAMKGKTGSRRR